MKRGQQLALAGAVVVGLVLLLVLGTGGGGGSGTAGAAGSPLEATRSAEESKGHPRTGTGAVDRTRAVVQDTSQKDFSCKDPRFALNPKAAKPDFMLIGVAKGGSTSFSNYLPTHPLVDNISVKEPNFWTWKYMDTVKYQNMFINTDNAIGSGKVIVGEYSTSYILHPLTPKRVHQFVPDAKIIVLLRNPIDRAYSHYTMSLRSHLEVRSFESVIAKEMLEVDDLRGTFRQCFNSNSCSASQCYPAIPMHRHDLHQTKFSINNDKDMKDYFFTSYLFRSIYDDSVERWLSLYPREQILFLRSEDLFNDPATTMEEARKFLELPEFDFMEQKQLQVSWGGGASNRYTKPHSYTPMLPRTRELLRTFFKPYNERLYALLGRNMEWD